jgi:Cu(I)/Ag(I) efflux system membrane fusion protein
MTMISKFVRLIFDSVLKRTFKHKLTSTLLFLIAIFLIAGCKQYKKSVAKKDVFYTCSMHPQIKEAHAGTCPICGMNLIPVQKGTVQKSDEIQLSEQQVQLGNIHVDTFGKEAIGSETALTATLNYDQQKLTSVSSRVMGRVERLYHKNTGEYIRKGEPLMEIYSEELNSAKQQYLLALEKRQVLDNSVIDFDQVINSAKTKLLLWGMSETQVMALAASNKASLTTTVYSNESGYITELLVQEGQYLNEGGLIVQLADLSILWAEAQVYTSQFSQINSNINVTVQLPGIGKSLTGKAVFMNPEISSDKRINLLRVTIPNANNSLKPGMVAYVILKAGVNNTLTLPIDAVIRDGKGASVWVQTGKNIFKNKMVTIGIETNDRVEITSGMSPGEVVVTQGAYLINSEYVFKNGASPMAGMKM